MAGRWAVFMDKDGTLLQNVPFNADTERMLLAPGAQEGLRILGRLAVPLIVVSNQPGIALGAISAAAMRAVGSRLGAMFAACGAKLTAFLYCPHHPEGTNGPFAIHCDCRKPASGLLTRAAREHGIDLTRSWMIGDILDDIEAGCRMRCRTILIDNGNETLWQWGPMRVPDHITADFFHAAAIVKEFSSRTHRAASFDSVCP